MNVWEDSDTAEILSQLLCEKKIKICTGLWNGKVNIIDENSIDSKLKNKIKSILMKN